MAKKRKAASAGSKSQEAVTGLELDPRESRKRIKTYEDVAGSDDEFHLNQDEVRLGEGPAAKRRRKIAEDEEFLQASDEEILAHSEPEDDFHSDSDDGAAERRDDGADDEDELGGWGTSKDALYGHDAIETEEQALEEEQEAIRLQKKQLQQLRAADYGFDEDDWQQDVSETTTAQAGGQGLVSEVLPQLQIASDMGSAERLKLLKSRYPEFEPLSRDLLSLQERHARLAQTAKTSSVAQVKLRAASAYLGALVMYFSLFTSTASLGGKDVVAVPATQLRDHPVMVSLVRCRELWTNVSSLPESSTEDAELGEESSEVHELEAEESDEAPAIESTKPAKRTSRAERHAAAVQAASEARKAERLQRAEADFAGLDALVSLNSKSGKKAARRQKASGDDLDLGDEAPLTAREAADKAQKKKSLRFYTSQIAQKANKRGNAGRTAGGDDDIPHRERLRDRQARLNAEAEARGKRPGDAPGADLGGDSDEEDHQQARSIRAAADDDDEYYDLIAAKTTKKKFDKAALAEAQRQAALQGGEVIQQETVGEDGKRKISYMIEKNKGLTPHRKKDVRNPRVKKRKKYDEKKKKLASIKPVYKGGEGRGGYGGELTGIKGGLVKSTKLS
ncbi:Putative sas10 domain-containing protein [Septoria linicola]|uniref:Sas10 domain-containing protein n=1 Tax=Septoria linicola TaxID=215465 RepID=A0A9Q9AL43_9PEZI|nr:putative sas10 domain-containing protein [Septoria linicola]USW46811.1 Putative sas10 domain-containing protein [Septoria linicola]